MLLLNSLNSINLDANGDWSSGGFSWWIRVDSRPKSIHRAKDMNAHEVCGCVKLGSYQAY